MGEALTITGPKSYDFVFGQDYNNWDDSIASMEITTIDKLRVTCFWSNVLSSNSKISETIEVGWSSDETHVTEQTATEEFTMAVEEGYEYAGASGKVSLSRTVS